MKSCSLVTQNTWWFSYQPHVRGRNIRFEEICPSCIFRYVVQITLWGMPPVVEAFAVRVMHARHKTAGIGYSVHRLVCLVQQCHSSLRSFFVIIIPSSCGYLQSEVDKQCWELCHSPYYPFSLKSKFDWNWWTCRVVICQLFEIAVTPMGGAFLWEARWPNG